MPPSSGHGGDPLSFEGSLENSIPRAGYRQDDYPYVPPVVLWRGANAIELGTGTIPNTQVAGGMAAGGAIVKWDHDEGGTNHPIQTSFLLDEHFAAEQFDMLCHIWARKVDTADENPDLALVLFMQWVDNDGNAGSLSDLGVAALQTPAVSSVGATGSAPFERLEIDIGAALRDANAILPRGVMMEVLIYPHETVGTTDMDLEVRAVKFRSRRHPAMHDRSLRRG